jgi:hypothetical protein
MHEDEYRILRLGGEEEDFEREKLRQRHRGRREEKNGSVVEWKRADIKVSATFRDRGLGERKGSGCGLVAL